MLLSLSQVFQKVDKISYKKISSPSGYCLCIFIDFHKNQSYDNPE